MLEGMNIPKDKIDKMNAKKTSSLESKAKTGKEIVEYTNSFLDKENKAEDAKCQWVPLEEAQKLEKELADVKEVRDVLGRKHNEIIDERNNALDKIKEANKEIEELKKKLDWYKHRPKYDLNSGMG